MRSKSMDLFLCDNGLRHKRLMKFEQRKRIHNSFITSHFSYWPLVSMFHNWHLNNGINHIHETALRIIYQDDNSSFEGLLRKDSSLTIHQRNLKLLVTEMFHVKIVCAPDIIKEIFEIVNRNYNFRHDFLIKRCNIDILLHWNSFFYWPKNMGHFNLIAAKMQPYQNVLKWILKDRFLITVTVDYVKHIFNV